MSRVFLYPRPGYVPKVPSVVPRPVILQAFHPPPFQDANQEKLNCVCPVRALDIYVHRAALWRKSDHHFLCYDPHKKGLPANKQTLSRWIVDAITSYESSDLPSPLGVRTHSTRSTRRPLRPFHLAHCCKILVTLRDGPPLWPSSCSIASTFKPLPAPQFSLPRLVSYTLGRDLSVWWREHIVPKAFDAARSSRRETSQVMYVTLVHWGNETLQSQAILSTFLRVLTSLEAAAAFTAYIHISERENKQVFPKHSTQRLVPSGNQGYIRNLGRLLIDR